MNDRDRLLVEVLALTDATWLPQRTFLGNVGANTWQLRAGYGQGLPWTAGGAEAERKSANRLRTALVDEGLLLAFYPKRTRIVHLRLVDAAEVALRRRLGLPGQLSARLSMREIARRSKRPATRMEHVWVDERKLIRIGTTRLKAGSAEEAREAAVVEELLLWAFGQQLVEGRATLPGLAYYRLTERGWAWLDAGEEPPDDDLLPVDQVDQPARRYYAERLRVNLERLTTAMPEWPNDTGELPLPAGGMVGELLEV